jgi:hypothetical protein
MSKELGFGKRRLIAEIIKQTWDVENPYDVKLGLNDILFIIQEMNNDEGRIYLEGNVNKTSKFDAFRYFAKHLLYRNLANFDSMVLLTSEKGSGKSSFAILLARAWCQLLGIRFDPNRHIAYSNKDVMNKVDSLKKFEPLICDEGVRFMCLSGDSIIQTKDGNFKIKDLQNKQNFEVISYNENSKKFEYKKARTCI